MTLVLSAIAGTRALAFSTATIYNPLSLSNTTGTTYPNHPVQFFSGWTNRFAIDITSPDQYADRAIYLWGPGTDWSTAHVLTGSAGNNAPISWTAYYNSSCTVVAGTEYAMAVALDLSNGQTAGFSVSHLSNYHYAAGASISQGAQIANLSYLSSSGTLYAYIGGVCQTSATAPHVHVESARTGTTTYNDWNSVSGPTGDPYWYYNY